MLDKHAIQAAKNHLPLKLNRRQLLRSISLIGAGAGAAIALQFNAPSDTVLSLLCVHSFAVGWCQSRCHQKE